jgi:predicted HicB family RNase H-like nuclease
MMEYKGYTAKIEFDNDAGLFHGRVINLRDVITFQGRSVDELREEFRNSVEDYLEFCEKRGEQPEKPFSGKFVVRIDPQLHRAVAVAAAKEECSLNTWAAKTFEMALNHNLYLTASFQVYHDLWAAAPFRSETLTKSLTKDWNPVASERLGELAGLYQQTGSQGVIHKRRVPSMRGKVELTSLGEGYRNAS